MYFRDMLIGFYATKNAFCITNKQKSAKFNLKINLFNNYRSLYTGTEKTVFFDNKSKSNYDLCSNRKKN